VVVVRGHVIGILEVAVTAGCVGIVVAGVVISEVLWVARDVCIEGIASVA
jgi:hypothetical protein